MKLSESFKNIVGFMILKFETSKISVMKVIKKRKMEVGKHDEFNKMFNKTDNL